LLQESIKSKAVLLFLFFLPYSAEEEEESFPLVFFLPLAMCQCYTCVEQSEVGILETCGKYKTTAKPGCHMLTPCADQVAGTVSLRLQEHMCTIESKTKDNVFVNVRLTLQYQILPEKVESAFYTLSAPVSQIEAYIFNSIRGKIPLYDLDALFQERSTIAKQLKEEVDLQMEQYGYEIMNALITEIEPARSVRDAMNAIQMNQRLKAAALDEAEGKKLRVIKAAEAESEAKRLSGVGLAEQRKAIVAGLQASIEQFHEGVQDLSNEDIMSLLLLNQYFDTLKEVAQASQSSTLFLSHAGGLDAVAEQMMHGIIKSSKKHN
jgi:regulator of protease activity HflC (stomatin/prohibitin superfamily)